MIGQIFHTRTGKWNGPTRKSPCNQREDSGATHMELGLLFCASKSTDKDDESHSIASCPKKKQWKQPVNWTRECFFLWEVIINTRQLFHCIVRTKWNLDKGHCWISSPIKKFHVRSTTDDLRESSSTGWIARHREHHFLSQRKYGVWMLARGKESMKRNSKSFLVEPTMHRVLWHHALLVGEESFGSSHWKILS